MKNAFTPQNVRTIFFDLNNTMVDPQRSFEKCFVNIVLDFIGRWDPDDPEAAQKALQIYMAEWNKKLKQLKKKPSGVQEARKQCLKAALKNFPFPVDDAFSHNFFRELKKQHGHHAVLFPQVADTVKYLSQHYQLGIISNGSKNVQEDIVQRVGLSSHIPPDRIFTSKKGVYRKPNPAIFQNALKTAGVRASQAVMVGDSWNNDILGAVKCGMNAIWLYRLSPKKISQQKVGKEKVIVIRQFQQLQDLFASAT